MIYERKRMMQKIVLIGGGYITKFYKTGLCNSQNLSLIALADVNENCVAHTQVFPNLPFYTDYKKMLFEQKPDVVHICVGVQNHFKILKDVLEQGFNALIEKPLCCSLEQTEILYQTARQNHVRFDVVYHFRYGDEMKYLKDHISEFGKIKRWSFTAHEQYAYCEKHIVAEEKRSLGDAWVDVASNLFSDMALLVDIENLKKTREIQDTDPVSGLVRYAHKTFENKDGVELDLLVDWMTSGVEKISVIETEKGRILIDHQKQTIYFDGRCIYENKPKIHRMHDQYENYWKSFRFDQKNEILTRQIQNAVFL